MSDRRPRIAVWKFASCDGCQLTLLDCEDELLALTELIDIAYFLEASSAAGRGPYDLSLVEGSISTAADIERIHHVRDVSKRRTGAAAVSRVGVIAGSIDSSSGSASVTPAPRRKVRRGMCFFWMNMFTPPSLSSETADS
jgi:coenzyme F420-reducing hydrogenase gamma subunit